MSDVLLRFEREDREGFVAVGSYLVDAAKRMGIDLTAAVETEKDTEPAELPIEISSGADVLSKLTDEEEKLIADGTLGKGQRLASHARVERPGEVVVMTTETKKKKEAEETETEKAAADYSKRFAELPLEKKLSQLVELEMMALGDTVSFVLNSPYAVANKIMDVMSEFGLKKEAAEKNATRPAEHTSETAATDKKKSSGSATRTRKAGKEKNSKDDAD